MVVNQQRPVNCHGFSIANRSTNRTSVPSKLPGYSEGKVKHASKWILELKGKARLAIVVATCSVRVSHVPAWTHPPNSGKVYCCCCLHLNLKSLSLLFSCPNLDAAGILLFSAQPLFQFPWEQSWINIPSGETNSIEWTFIDNKINPVDCSSCSSRKLNEFCFQERRLFCQLLMDFCVDQPEVRRTAKVIAFYVLSFSADKASFVAQSTNRRRFLWRNEVNIVSFWEMFIVWPPRTTCHFLTTGFYRCLRALWPFVRIQLFSSTWGLLHFSQRKLHCFTVVRNRTNENDAKAEGNCQRSLECEQSTKHCVKLKAPVKKSVLKLYSPPPNKSWVRDDENTLTRHSKERWAKMRKASRAGIRPMWGCSKTEKRTFIYTVVHITFVKNMNWIKSLSTCDLFIPVVQTFLVNSSCIVDATKKESCSSSCAS